MNSGTLSSQDSATAETTLTTEFGERYVFRDTAVDTGGELLRMDTYLNPGVRRPLHSHPNQDERFIVHSGTLGLAVEDEELLVEDRETATVSAGTPHTFWNAGDGEMHMTTEHRPALRFEEFIRVMVQLDREGGLNDAGMPANPLVGAAVISGFSDEMQPEDLPVPVQRLLFPVLAKIGDTFGYGVPEYQRSTATGSEPT